jgi:hypothetical protein
VLEHIRAANSGSANFDLCVLAFDEIKVSEQLVYNSRTDQVMGPHRQVQVALIRGLLFPYKQVVFVDFDVPMKKDLLLELIRHLDKVKFKVVAIVSDMGSTNVALWLTLQVTDTKPFFVHPCNKEEKIFLFPDAPHLLKLCRNHLLDRGYVLPNGETGQKSDI